MATVTEKSTGILIELADNEIYFVEANTICIVEKDCNWLFVKKKMND